jgi:2-succinyl-5-enolpyruvyl-6-hydroxy-3-cyclohexene-1-carboxylate synthase
MHSRDATTSFANALVDEWARAGVAQAVIAPGSRSTPLALALVRDGRFRVHVVLDERSAAFLALGVGIAGGGPAVLLCTSGTAAANFHPAVIEASHASVPMLVCTADRPPELRDVGAPQTIDQCRLFGTAVRWFHDPGPPDDASDDGTAGARWRALACRAVAHARGGAGARPGPVHLNLPFREPLVPTGAPLVDAPGRRGGEPWTRVHAETGTPAASAVAPLVDLTRDVRRGVVVAGFGAGIDPTTLARFSAATGWPVLADAVSNARRDDASVSAYEALLRAPRFADEHRPDAVVQLGAPLTSKVANAWLEGVPATVVGEHDDWLDPTRTADQRIVASPTAVFDAAAAYINAARDDDAWMTGWRRADDAARAVMDRVLDADDDLSEARVARDVARLVPDGTRLAVASSVPVRALEWCMAPRQHVDVFANRGANGIDGFVSTVFGIAAVSSGAPTVGLLGDLCFLHDTNGLLAGGSAPLDATLVVVDNEGGAIFSYLAQRDLPEFETLFATPQRVDLVDVAAAHGVKAERVHRASQLAGACVDAWGAGGRRIVVAAVDRERSRARHGAMWDAVRAELDQ